jgi:methionine biosynthesis protein MetW
MVSGVGYYDTYWTERAPLTGMYPELERLLAGAVRPGMRCLDIGCGDGATAGAYLAERADSYTGVDVSDRAVQAAKRRGLDAQTIEDPALLPFPNEAFDLIVCLETLEHLVDPLETAVEARRVLADGGRLIVTVPNTVYWRRRLDFALVGRWNPMGDRLSIAKPWRDPHLRFFTLPSLEAMLAEAGYRVEHAGGHWGGLAADIPGRNRLLGERGATAETARRASRFYRALERRAPGLLGFRLHAVAVR